MMPVKSQCMKCGLRSDMTGEGAVKILKTIDEAHDLLRPECEAAQNRRQKGETV